MQSMKFSAIFVSALVFSATDARIMRKSKLDINQNNALAPQFVANPDAPAVKVCGTGIKATFFLRNRCEPYYEHSKEIGKCDTGMPSDTCDAWSPADDPRFGAYQSYKIEQC